MFAKKTISMLFAGAMLAAAVPAFADHDFRRFDSRFNERQAVQRPVFTHGQRGFEGQPAYRGQQYYNGQHAYRGHPVYAQPAYAPGYGYASQDNSAAGAIGGAMIGAMIGSNVGYGTDRTAAMAVGAILGGLLGHELGR